MDLLGGDGEVREGSLGVYTHGGGKGLGSGEGEEQVFLHSGNEDDACRAKEVLKIQRHSESEAPNSSESSLTILPAAPGLTRRRKTHWQAHLYKRFPSNASSHSICVTA
jgi:hypothetical protein